MELETLANLAEFFGGIAVLMSLMFLIHQVREGNLNTRDSNFREVMQHNVVMGRLVGGDSGIASIYRRGCESIHNLNMDERWQFGSLMMAMFCDFSVQFVLFNKGRLDKKFWLAIEHNMKFYLRRPGVRDWWQSQPFKLDPDFTAYVDAYVEEIALKKAVGQQESSSPEPGTHGIPSDL